MMNRFGYKVFSNPGFSFAGNLKFLHLKSLKYKYDLFDFILFLHSSPGFLTWSPTPSQEWLDKTAVEKAARAEVTAPQEARPGRKSPSLRTMNLSELSSTAVRHMLDIITPSLKIDGKRHFVRGSST